MIKINLTNMAIFLLALLMLGGFVSATAPTTPSTISPTNYSKYLGDPGPELSCSGSTDAEGDPINYEFVLNPDNLSTAETYNGSQTYHFLNSFDDWVSRQTYCQNIGQGWDLAVIQDATENAVVAGLDDGEGTWIAYNNVSGTFQWYPIGKRLSNYTNWGGGYPDTSVGGYASIIPAGTWATDAISAQRDVVCEYFGLDTNYTLQNSTSTTYNYNNFYAGPGDVTWTCRACDNNSECSDYIPTQTFSEASIINCDYGSSNSIIDFLFRDEDYISGTQPMNYTLNLGITSGSSNIELTDTQESITNTSVCMIGPTSLSASLDNGAIISNQGDGLVTRKIFLDYLLEGNILNTSNPMNATMYSTELVDAVAVTVRVSENGVKFTYVNDGALIYVYRIIPTLGTYQLIAVDDLIEDPTYPNYGKAEFYLRDGYYYKFCIIDEDNQNCERYYVNAVTQSDSNEFNYDTTSTSINEFNLFQTLNLQSTCSGVISNSDFQSCSVTVDRVGERFDSYTYSLIMLEYNYTYNGTSESNSLSPINESSTSLTYQLNSSLINESLENIKLYFYTDASTNENNPGAVASIYWSINAQDLNNRTIQLGFTKAQIDSNPNFFYFMIIMMGLVISLLFNNRIKGSGFVMFTLWAVVWATQGATYLWYIVVLVFMVKMSTLGKKVTK